MGKYANLNVLSSHKIENMLSNDAIDQVAGMINATGANRSQRKQLAKALGKVSNIYSQAQKRADKNIYKEYQKSVDENFRRFFAVVGIVMKSKYNWEETEDKEEITELFEQLNAYLEEYRDLSTDEVSKICEETTGIVLQAM